MRLCLRTRRAHSEAMPFLDPASHKVDLRAALEAEGWDVEIIESAAHAWWMNELWRLRSRWRPVGAELFVSFVVDPTDERRPRRRVFVIGVGREPAENWHATNVERFDLAPNWPAKRARLVAHAAELRDAGV
jgi:hypothetical protein